MPVITLRRRPYWERLLRFPLVFVQQCIILWGEGPVTDVLKVAWILARLTVRRNPFGDAKATLPKEVE